MIWPFECDDRQSTVIVEVFPRYFPLLRGCSPKMANHAFLNAALAAFDSEPSPSAPDGEDEGDAIVTAAALRSLSDASLTALLPDVAAREGWIFGVPAGAS